MTDDSDGCHVASWGRRVPQVRCPGDGQRVLEVACAVTVSVPLFLFGTEMLLSPVSPSDVAPLCQVMAVGLSGKVYCPAEVPSTNRLWPTHVLRGPLMLLCGSRACGSSQSVSVVTCCHCYLRPVKSHCIYVASFAWWAVCLNSQSSVLNNWGGVEVRSAWRVCP